MAGLVPFNRKNSISAYDSFYDMLDDFFNRDVLPTKSFERQTFKIDVKETDNDYVIEADLPGVKKEEVSLDLNDGKLTISVVRDENIDKSKENYVHKERVYSSMARSIYLQDSKADGIKAKLDNGVLTINVNKVEKTSKSCKIDIE
ncbi:MAG: Hsp20/alpha crystallin family protein [Oscillospiraceae bacterium]|nr:Hsp20/alpha crystallin family protein [Oscillospiraceae bacterium]